MTTYTDTYLRKMAADEIRQHRKRVKARVWFEGYEIRLYGPDEGACSTLVALGWNRDIGKPISVHIAI